MRIKAILASAVLAFAPAQLFSQDYKGTLILAVDTSSSIDNSELELQMQGYELALEQFPVLEDFYLVVLTFSREPIIHTQGSKSEALNYFKSYNDLSRWDLGRYGTCIANMLQKVNYILPSVPKPVILDISGDGVENCVSDYEVIRQVKQLNRANVEINAVIIGEDTTVKQYYQQILVNNKLLEAKNFYELESTLYEKISFELANLEKKSGKKEGRKE